MNDLQPSASSPIISTRVLNASRENIFRALSDPNTLAKWWGPKGFTSKFREFNFCEGGIWRLIMHAPDGGNYELTYEFVEIVFPQRISIRNPQSGHEFLLTMTITEEAGGTGLTWNMQFESSEEAKRVRGFVTEANEQNFDRLEEQLAAMASA